MSERKIRAVRGAVVEVYSNHRAPRGIDKVGTFLGWGVDSSYLGDECSGSETAAIVEYEDGTVGLVHPALLRFPV